jgi:cytochrome oxidase Cu insertion factor (SCO1/SenC/PrrC family)
MNTGQRTNANPTIWLRRYWPLVAGIVIGLVLAILVFPNLRPSTFHGTILQSPNPAPSFTLTTHTGQSVSLRDFQGELVVLFLGIPTVLTFARPL